MTPKALVLRAAGTNCDGEMVRAFRIAGASADLLHLDRLIAEPARLDEYDLIGFPGGFSYGDDIASGRVFAMRVRERLYSTLKAAVDRGACIIGACNGFQVLTQVGLLPGLGDSGHERREPGRVDPALPIPTTALAENAKGRFIDRWLKMEPNPASSCVWTQGLDSVPTSLMMLPIGHGEGRFVASSDAVLREIESRGLVALRYAEEDNVNGSQNRIAGICDPSGRVFGLMPHPERYLEWENHPFFTALPTEARRGDTPGLRFFRNAVEHVKSRSAVGV